MTLIRIFASTFCELMAVLMLMPIMTLHLAARGEPARLIGLFGAVLYVAIFLVTPFAAVCTKRFGLRATYVLSGATPLLAVTLLLQTTSLASWFLAASILGFFGGLRWVTAEAYVAQAAPAARRGAIIGAFETMVGACFVLGPLLVTVTGIDDQRPLWLALGLLMTGLLCLVGLPDLAAGSSGSSRAAFTALLRERPAIVLAAVIGGFVETGPATFLPVVSLTGGATAGTAASLVSTLGFGSFLLQAPIGHYADRLELTRLFRACLWVVLLGGIAMGAAGTEPLLLWVAAFVWGAAGGGIYTLAMITIGHAYRGVDLVGATAALVFAYALGGALSPAVSGFVIDAAPRHGFASLMAAVAVLGLMLIRTPTPNRAG